MILYFYIPRSMTGRDDDSLRCISPFLNPNQEAHATILRPHSTYSDDEVVVNWSSFAKLRIGMDPNFVPPYLPSPVFVHRPVPLEQPRYRFSKGGPADPSKTSVPRPQGDPKPIAILASVCPIEVVIDDCLHLIILDVHETQSPEVGGSAVQHHRPEADVDVVSAEPELWTSPVPCGVDLMDGEGMRIPWVDIKLSNRRYVAVYIWR